MWSYELNTSSLDKSRPLWSACLMRGSECCLWHTVSPPYPTPPALLIVSRNHSSWSCISSIHWIFPIILPILCSLMVMLLLASLQNPSGGNSAIRRPWGCFASSPLGRGCPGPAPKGLNTLDLVLYKDTKGLIDVLGAAEGLIKVNDVVAELNILLPELVDAEKAVLVF